jgi:hypothetical protein
VIPFALALTLLAGAPGDSAAAPATATTGTPVALGAPRFVQIASMAGVPSDSLVSGEFDAAFRGAFAQDALPGERLTSAGQWQQGLPLPNRFRLLEGDPAEDAWQLDIQIGAPAPAMGSRKERQTTDGGHSWHEVTVKRSDPRRRASRGMIVAWTLRVPDPSGAVGRTVEGHTAFYFPAAGSGAGTRVPGRYAYPWDDAGRIAATLVLEMLHHESGDLLPKERMDVSPARRVDAAAQPGGDQ